MVSCFIYITNYSSKMQYLWRWKQKRCLLATIRAKKKRFCG